MSQSVLASFDPLAIHPFTNTSGLLPKPIAPSQYPTPLPTANSIVSTTPASMANWQPTAPAMHSPQPKRASSPKSSSTAQRAPIFVPFRPERSSPDLGDILLKKKVSDLLSNKQTWSIDQATVPLRK